MNYLREEKGKVCTRIWLGSCVVISCPGIRCLRMKKITVIEANGRSVILEDEREFRGCLKDKLNNGLFCS